MDIEQITTKEFEEAESKSQVYLTLNKEEYVDGRNLIILLSDVKYEDKEIKLNFTDKISGEKSKLHTAKLGVSYKLIMKNENLVFCYMSMSPKISEGETLHLLIGKFNKNTMNEK